MQLIIPEAFDISCAYCGSSLQQGDYTPDKTGKGFWCEVCDMYNYFDTVPHDEKHRFGLYLEQPASNENRHGCTTNLKTHISPLRYPGGKTKLIRHAYAQLNPVKTTMFVEPFAGGASVGLSLLEAGVVEHLLLNDLDVGVSAFFQTIFSDPSELLSRLESVTPTREMFFESQKRILQGHEYKHLYEAAWDMLVVNRLSYSGIVKARPLGGKSGSQDELLARWNPTTLAKKIELLWALRARVSISNRDALEVIEENYWNEKATLFIDPPYVVQGARLYNKFFTEEDHIELSCLLESLYSTCPGADVQLYYDNAELITDIYSLPELIIIERKYSA